MSKPKILIVDDDPDIRILLYALLKARYETLFANDELSSLSTAQKYAPDLVILDLGIPGGDGFEVMSAFHRIPSLSAIPIIVVSAHDERVNHDRSLAAGARAFMQKPIAIAELLEVIRQVLSGA